MTDQPTPGQADRERALLEAGNEMARVLDQEIMPRYQELFEAAGLGAVSLSVAVEDAARVLARWRRAAGLGGGVMDEKADLLCTRCNGPIKDGYMIGDGDGWGQRFAHPWCYRFGRVMTEAEYHEEIMRQSSREGQG